VQWDAEHNLWCQKHVLKFQFPHFLDENSGKLMRFSDFFIHKTVMRKDSLGEGVLF
jgi:hypothetical protein